MESILEFLENNYIWFLVAAAILLLALIGFIVDSKRKQKKMEGNLDTLNSMEAAPVTETNVTPSVEPANVEMNTPLKAETSAPVMSQAEAPVEVNNNPVEQKVETFSFDANPVNNSTNMTFNDVPAPNATFEMPTVEPVVPKEEVIEPFNIGNPVVMNEAPAFEPVQNVEPVQPMETFQTVEPVQPMETFQTVEPVQSMEPVQPAQPVQSMEPVQPAQPSFTSTEEPIVKISE